MMNRGVENRKSEIVNRKSVSRGAKGEGEGEKGRGRERGGSGEAMVVSRLWNRDSRFGTRGYEPMGPGRRGWRGRKGMV